MPSTNSFLLKLAAFLLLILILFGPPFELPLFELKESRAAVLLRQTTNSVTGGNGSNSVTASFNQTPVAGNLLVAVLGAQGVTTIVQPTGWSTAINQSGSPSQAIFYKVAGASESVDVTVTVGLSMHLGLQIYEYSGIETNSPFESASSTTGTGTSVSSGSVVNLQPDALVIAAVVQQTANASFAGWTNSFTEQNDFANGTGSGGNRASYAGADRIVSATSTYSTAASSTISGAWRGQIAVFRADIQFQQASYRWFSNNDGTSVGSPLAAQDISATISTPGTPVRLRMLVHASSSQLAASGRNFKLQFAARGSGTCASPSGGSPAVYTDVATSTGVIRYYNNSTPADGDALTATSTDPTHSTHTVVNQNYEEANNFTNSRGAILPGQDGKWDFALVDSSAQAGETYCFRAVESDNTVFNTYSSYPQIVVGNIPPTITNVILNGGSSIALTEGTSTVIQATATVDDPNGFPDIATTTGKTYRSGVGESCSLDDNNCYQQSGTSCSLSGCSGTSCTATCSFPIRFHADPTDGGTPWESENWLSWMKVVDDSNASATATSSTGVDMLTLLALSVTSQISYGSLWVTSTTDPIAQFTVVSSTGNASMDVTLYGTNMTSGPNSIAVGNQRYATSAVPFADAIVLLANPGAILDLNLRKTTSSSALASSTVFWGIQIPLLTVSGDYTGTNSFIGTVNSLPWP